MVTLGVGGLFTVEQSTGVATQMQMHLILAVTRITLRIVALGPTGATINEFALTDHLRLTVIV